MTFFLRDLARRTARVTFVQAFLLMALCLVIFHTGALPLIFRLTGLALFAMLAIMHPAGALGCVILTAPLYLMPTTVDISARTLLLPLHEVALLITTAAVCWRWIGGHIESHRMPDMHAALRRMLHVFFAPESLLILAGVIGVALAVSEGRSAALREFRWLIVEPLLFYGLARAIQIPRETLIGAMALGGAFVGVTGAFQFVGVDLTPLIGEKRAFSENIIVVDGVRRVTSVYGHPNNLGLYLERVWPLAAAMAAWIWDAQRTNQAISISANRLEERSTGIALFFAVCALLSLVGVVVSFSRGAWLASVVAAVVLGFGWLWRRSQHRQARRRSALVLIGALLAGMTGLALMLRGGPGGGSVDARLLLWRESLVYLRQNPLGLGLDQFYYYHNPAFGRSAIDPSLIGTSEEFAAHPHNLLLDAWINVGPVGVLAFGLLLVRFYRNALIALGKQREMVIVGALAAMTAALFHGLVDRFYFVPDLAIAFWVLMAVVERSKDRVREPKTDDGDRRQCAHRVTGDFQTSPTGLL
ncbi:MAG: O-antigen ligase family protein [Roseiflexus sp.]